MAVHIIWAAILLIHIKELNNISRYPILSVYGYIYCITNKLNGKQYIGQHHWERPCLDTSYWGSGIAITQAIKKYGKNNFYIELLDFADSKELLDELELYYIAKYDACHDPNFYNLSIGGTGAPPGEDNPMYGKTLSAEHLQKLVSKRQGIPHTQETIDLMKKHSYWKGKHLPEDVKEKVSKNRKGKCTGQQNHWYGVNFYDNTGIPHSEETKRKIGETRKRRHIPSPIKGKKLPPHTDEWKHHISELLSGANHPRAKGVVQLTLDGEFVREYEYMKETEKFGFNYSCVKDCCHGQQKTHKGYKWIYSETYRHREE